MLAISGFIVHHNTYWIINKIFKEFLRPWIENDNQFEEFLRPWMENDNQFEEFLRPWMEMTINLKNFLGIEWKMTINLKNFSNLEWLTPNRFHVCNPSESPGCYYLSGLWPASVTGWQLPQTGHSHLDHFTVWDCQALSLPHAKQQVTDKCWWPVTHIKAVVGGPLHSQCLPLTNVQEWSIRHWQALGSTCSNSSTIPANCFIAHLKVLK